MSNYTPTETQIYLLSRSYYRYQIGCKNGLMSLIVPKRKSEVNNILQLITDQLNIPAREDTRQTLTSIIYMTVGAKSYEDVVARLQEATNRGLAGRPINNSVGGIIKLSLIAAKAYWDIRYNEPT